MSKIFNYKKEALNKARKLIKRLRREPLNYDFLVSCLREQSEIGNFSLTDICTSEKELERIRVKSCKTKAETWISCARKGIGDYERNIAVAAENLEKGGLSLADIGLSEKEFFSLVRRIKH